MLDTARLNTVVTVFGRALSTAFLRISHIEDSQGPWLSGKSPHNLSNCSFFAGKRSQTKRSGACYDEHAATPAYLVAFPDSLSLSLSLSLSRALAPSIPVSLTLTYLALEGGAGA
jgi:hypothetical protein